MLIAMAGLPASGKSTIAGLLGTQLRAAVVSVDPIEEAILRAGIDADQPTGLAAYLVAETLAESVLDSGQTIIVDAVNAVDPAREQWVALSARRNNVLRFVEVVCGDPELYRDRVLRRQRSLPHFDEPDWHPVEQSMEEYDSEWAGESGSVPRITLDTSKPVEDNVRAALAFLTG